ncbi:MAG: prepilin-type N-terminal cleavage/methylation domain-containing protein [Nitrospiria bacterium]
MQIKRNQGFTLIELVVVILIVAILAAAAYELLGDTTSTKVYGSARKIQSDIIFAQEQAMTHRIHYRMTFTSSPNGYTVQQCNSQTSPCPGWNNIIDPSTNTSPFTVTLNTGNYSGVSWTSTTFTGYYLEFNSAGVPLDGSTYAGCSTPPCPMTSTKSVSLNFPVIRSVSVTPGTGKTAVY